MQLQVYAAKALIEGSSTDDVNVTLTEVDGSEVLAQFSDREKLDSVDKSDILDYLHQLKLEEE